MNQNPPHGWPGPATSEFGPVDPQAGYGYGPPPRQGMSPGLIVALTVMAMLLLGVIGLAAFLVAPRFAGESAAPVTSTVSVTATAEESAAPTTVQPAQPARPAAAPAGAYECANTGGGAYSGVAVGSSVTSCEFAGAVQSEYLASGAGGDPAVVTAYSPVTGRNYTMSCSGGPVVTCRGGNNAVVHLY